MHTATRTLFRKYLFVLLGTLLTSLFAVSASAQVVTFSGKHLQTGGQYQVAADFNNDGKQDLALAGLDIEILLGLGDGTFQANG